LDYQRYLTRGNVDHSATMVFFGIFSLEYQSADNSIFAGFMASGKWALGLGIEGTVRNGVKIK